MRQNATRERIRAYIGKHPRATHREIMKACDVSTTSLVSYHLNQIERTQAVCPVCKGTGCVPEPHEHERNRSAERKAMAKTLREAGYSMRQIQDFLGWKSVQSVTAALKSPE